jgi:hypothetical protein
MRRATCPGLHRQQGTVPQACRASSATIWLPREYPSGSGLRPRMTRWGVTRFGMTYVDTATPICRSSQEASAESEGVRGSQSGPSPTKLLQTKSSVRSCTGRRPARLARYDGAFAIIRGHDDAIPTAILRMRWRTLFMVGLAADFHDRRRARAPHIGPRPSPPDRSRCRSWVLAKADN